MCDRHRSSSAGNSSRWAELTKIMDSIDASFPPFVPIRFEDNDCRSVRAGIASRASKGDADHASEGAGAQMSCDDIADTECVKTAPRFSLIMFANILLRLLDKLPDDKIVRLLRVLLESNSAYGTLSRSTLYNLTGHSCINLVKHLILTKYVVNDSISRYTSDSLASRDCIQEREASKLACACFYVKGQLFCIQLQKIDVIRKATLRLVLISPNRKHADSHFWQSIREVEPVCKGCVTKPNTLIIDTISRAPTLFADQYRYEVSLIWCTCSCICFMIFVIDVSSIPYVVSSTQVHHSHAPVKFLKALHKQQYLHLKESGTPLYFVTHSCFTVSQPYCYIISPYLPILFAVADRHVETFFLERGEDGCTIRGVLESANGDPVVIVAEEAVFSIVITIKETRPCMIANKMPISIPVSLFLPVKTDSGSLLLADTTIWSLGTNKAGDLIIHRHSVTVQTVDPVLAHILKVLKVFHDEMPSAVWQIISIGAIWLTPTVFATVILVCLVESSATSLLLVECGNTKNISTYYLTLPVKCLTSDEKSRIWALFEKQLLCRLA